jgi:hypothetical protein
MATVNLGRIKPVFKGAYSGGTAYVVDDIVTSGNETFICIQASTGNATSNASYWTKLAAKGTDGTNGTDVGTTITTQGDILYRDGSGLARLGAGTSGQVLQTGGTGANPSWTTMSSDMVKVASTEATNVQTLNFSNIFTTDYHNYYFIGSALVKSNSHQVAFNPIQSSGNLTANRYETSIYGYKQHSGGSNDSLQIDAGSNDNNGGRLGWGRTSTELNFTILLSNPLGTSNYKMHKYECAAMDASYLYHRTGSTVWTNNTNAFTGFRFFNADNGNCDWKITAYGIRK